MYNFLFYILVVLLNNFSYLCHMVREIVAYKDYYTDFMSKLNEKEQLKIRRALLLFSQTEKIPSHFIKYIEDDIYEFRVTYGNNEFRIFFIYDGEKMVILFNAFRKKTQKTPRSEIAKAKRIKRNYYEDKNATL